MRRLLIAAVAVVAGGVLVFQALGEGAVYYRTPQELAQDPPEPGDRLRVGGLVVVGSVHAMPHGVAFTLTDGVRNLPVRHTGEVSPVFAGGQGAVVEGRMDGGVLLSDRLMVKHSNEYRPPVASTRVGLTEWAVTVGDPVLRPGPVTLEVTNAGSTAHDLIVTGIGVSAHTPVLAPGQTATLRLDAPSGALLTLVCGVTGHETLGMTGTLRVADL
ncbi:cytochrome c maturation protein CcmE [Nonomuraea sp. AD125B]|uniref:cytochrome c maturation protein CcmE domain-containing protein n=1 Tax=Nonomuraea sp. AD125B TaxID=3242897 RepID=UPI003529B1C2